MVYLETDQAASQTLILSKTMDLSYAVIIKTAFLCACGLFNIMEVFIVNLLLSTAVLATIMTQLTDERLMLGFYFSQMIFYNLIDIKQHSTKEIDNFNNLLRVDYRCNKISEFVDRLLPRHI